MTPPAVLVSGYVEQLILCVIKGTIIVAISLSWILSRCGPGIPWAFQCLLDTLRPQVWWRRLHQSVGPMRDFQVPRGHRPCCHPSCSPATPLRAILPQGLEAAAGYGPGGRVALPLKGLWLVSRFESSQAQECVSGVIPLEGLACWKGSLCYPWACVCSLESESQASQP